MTLLTIAIPTYNRVEYLKELLPELLAQCKPYPEIEVLVSDNGTTDMAFPYVVCSIYGNRHPGELCDYYTEE